MKIKISAYLSAFSTASTAGVSSARTSCSTYSTSMRGGIFNSPAAIIFNNVDLPVCKCVSV